MLKSNNDGKVKKEMETIIAPTSVVGAGALAVFVGMFPHL